MKNIWGWVIGIIVVVALLWALLLAMGGSTESDMASPSPQTATTSPTGASANEPAPVKPVTKQESVGSILSGLTGDSTYVNMFNSYGLSATVGKGPYTVFVSTDAGFNLLPAGTVSKMTAAEKKRFVQYSIVTGKMLDINAVNSGNVRTLSGDTLNFHVGSTGLVQVNSSYALGAYKATNGIIYILNQPLLPPQKSTY